MRLTGAPASAELAAAGYAGTLGDGLVRRWSTAADTERLAALLGVGFREGEDEPVNPRAMHEAELMMAPGFPFMTPDDVAVVQDTSRPGRPLVACTTFWRHRWSFAGIPFGVTRPEMVATHPAYRRRGLVRALFEMIHARGAAEGHLLAAITGIAYFYRQFGYEYVLELEGGRTTFLPLVPEREGDAPEACALRPAGRDDVPAIAAIYDSSRGASLVWHEAPEARWRFLVDVWENPSVRDRDITRAGVGGRLWMIVDAAGTARGYALLPVRRSSGTLAVGELAFAPGTDVPALAPSLLRALREHGAGLPAMRPGLPPLGAIRFELGRDHPLCVALADALAPRLDPPYAWYVRIPDVPAFIRHVAPALERRLAGSLVARHTGSLRVDLYRYGMELRFQDGRLVAVAPWRAPDHENDEASLGCPPLVFLQLLLGYRSLDDLRAAYPDVHARDDARPLVTTLFPRLPSAVAPLG